MVGSPDPPSLQDLAALEEKWNSFEEKREMEGWLSPVSWSWFLGPFSANLVPRISNRSSFGRAVPFSQPAKIQEDWVWENIFFKHI